MNQGGRTRRSVGIAASSRNETVLLVWVLLVAGLLLSVPVWAQSVPEVVRPRSESPILPPGPSDGPAPRPRSENPLAESGVGRPIPDTGVITPPASALGSPTTVIRPPADSAMPVIPPPGSAGGAPGVVPR